MRLSICLALIALSGMIVGDGHATLDDFAGPLVPQGRYLYSFQTEYFHTQERGEHGSAIFGTFDSEPDYWTLRNALRFTPVDGTEITVGLSKNFSQTYQRLTYDPAGDLAFLNDYRLDQFHEFQVDLRHRRDNHEYFIESYGNDQNASWHSAPGNVEANFFTHIDAHFEDIALGTRWSGEGSSAEVRLRYRGGNLRRTNDFFGTSPATRRNYYHDLRTHITPEIRWHLQPNDEITLRTGVAYTTPYKYKFEFQQFNPSGTTKFISATYALTHQFFFPLAVELNKRNGWLFRLSADFTVIKQRLDAYLKDFDDSVTIEPERELIYYNAQPTLEVSYTSPVDEGDKEDSFGSLTKELLRKNQYRISFLLRQDMTSLDKNEFNGTQNIIDPYNSFQYPLDNFVAGTEYAAFLTGNSSSSFANVQPQDYTRVEAGVAYGITDQLNTEIRSGFQSRSAVHQYVFDNSISNRHYVFEPFHFVRWITDWRVGEANLLTVDMYYVPKYKTFMNTDIHPQEFEVENEYFRAIVAFKRLF